MASFRRINLPVALAVIAAGAILLSSCEEPQAEVDPAADEALMTEYSENLTIVESENGKRSYRFSTPLVEGYSQAREPYREFRKGIRMVTYQDDSLASVDVVLTANYAIYYEHLKLWEAKGNVVVEKFDGKKLYTQQLFWNATTKKVYSNVDTRVVQEGRSDIIGAGFESDEEFKDWRFRYMRGKTEVDMTPREPADSTQQADRPDSAATARPAAQPAAEKPASRPAAKPAARPAAKPAAQPENRPSEQPAERRTPPSRQQAPRNETPRRKVDGAEETLRRKRDAADESGNAEVLRPSPRARREAESLNATDKK